MYYNIDVAKKKTKCVGDEKDCIGIKKGDIRLSIQETNYMPHTKYKCVVCGIKELKDRREHLGCLLEMLFDESIKGKMPDCFGENTSEGDMKYMRCDDCDYFEGCCEKGQGLNYGYKDQMSFL